MRRWLILVLSLMILPFPARAGGEPARSIGGGETTFWDGPFVEAASNTGCGENNCWTYKLRVEEPGYRLRIGIDRPEIGDVFVAEIFAPNGNRAGTISPGTDLYSDEYLTFKPATGTWRIQVRAESVTESAFRLRAKLEAREPSLGVRTGRVLPNLQVLPPHEASFLKPISNGTTPGEPVSADNEGADSCHPEERAEEGAIRCLRFAFGIRNTGRGPLALFRRGTEGMEQELLQHIMLAEGGSDVRAAGTATFHKTHGHYHHNDAVALELFRVVDEDSGELESASPKHFKGFAHRDELLRDWHTFYPTWAKQGFGLLPGWADIYEWDRPGNYIEFGLNGDGRYVVRMWADPVKGVLESNERDNVGYTYLEVTGSDVELLESGRGRDPWDPCKIVVGFGGHPDPAPQHPRPKSCPKDTI